VDRRYIQLYSIKDETAKDFVGALKKVAQIGYTGVEFASGNYGGLSAKELKTILSDLNLDPISTHITSDAAPKHVGYAVELGIKYIIDPMKSFDTYEAALDFSKTLNEVGKICKDNGLLFGYHNHRHEFLESKDGTLLETLIANTDPKYVCFELDVGWATCAGCDVPAFLQKHAGRFKMIHVKECSTVAGPEKLPDFAGFPKDENGQPKIPPEVLKQWEDQNRWNVPTGKGAIDWVKIKDAAISQGADAFIVEREYNYANDIFKCVEEDCAFLKSL